MKLKLLFGFLLLTQFLTSQTFTEASPASEFDGAKFSSIAFSDVDGDGDKDVLITGENSSGDQITKLYTNNGMGAFTEITGTSFDGVARGSITFSDVDGDEDEDVLITGENSSSVRIAKLYINDGLGTFTEMTGTPFDGVAFSSTAFSDVDGDGDEDVLITGWTSSGDRITKLYTNDGMGTFTEVTGTPFEGVIEGLVAFSDVDDDGDEDVLILGNIFLGAFIAKLYTNDGTGTFTEIMGTPFEGIIEGSVAFSDIDDDGDNDVLITGRNASFRRIAKLYTNDGMGTFTEVTGTPFNGVYESSIAFSDVDGDGDDDVLLTGRNNTFARTRVAELFLNDGMGTFSEITDTPFEGVNLSSIAFSDVDSDGDEDVLITGENSLIEPVAKLYINDRMTSSSNELFDELNLHFAPYPNPVKSNKFHLDFYSSENGSLGIKIYDINGRLLSQRKEFVVTGQQTFAIDVTSLSQGSYFIQLDNGKRKGRAKFVVQ